MAGARSNSVAMVKKMGTSRAALAVLLESSVRKMTKQTTAPTMAQSGHASITPPSSLAIKRLAPEEPRIALSASPPPKSISTPQSVPRSICFHETTRATASATTAASAIHVSMSEMEVHFASFALNIHESAVRAKIPSVILRGVVKRKTSSSSRACLASGFEGRSIR